MPSDCRRLFSMSRTLLRAVSTFGVIRVAAFRGSSVLQQRCYTPGSALNVTVEHLQDEHTGIIILPFNYSINRHTNLLWKIMLGGREMST